MTVPDSDDGTVATLVESARDDSVTALVLTGDDAAPALIDLLGPDEQPHYVLRGAVIDIVDGERAGAAGDDVSDRAPSAETGRRGGTLGVSRKIPDRGFDALTVVTDRRVIAVVPRSGDDEGGYLDVTHERAEEVCLERMKGNRRLVVEAPSGELRADVSGSPSATCEAAAGYARDRVGSVQDRSSAGREETSGAEPADPLSAIERLADLRDRGAITETEFREKKRELLDRV